jgi:hypothetical protein
MDGNNIYKRGPNAGKHYLTPPQKATLGLFAQVGRAFVRGTTGPARISRQACEDGTTMPVILCHNTVHDRLVEHGYIEVGGHKDGYRFWQLVEADEDPAPKRDYKYY